MHSSIPAFKVIYTAAIMIPQISKISRFIKFLILASLVMSVTCGDFMTPDFKVYAKVNKKETKRQGKSKRTGSKSKNKRSKKRKNHNKPAISTLWTGENGEWIHKGRRSIIIYKDSTGVVRAMTPFTTNPHAGKEYAHAINEYAKKLYKDSIRVYSLIAPTQGEYYMPDLTSTRGAEQHAIEMTAEYLDSIVTPVFVNDLFLEHKDEDIYNRTDHHWSPLGAYYASAALAKAAGVKFLPLNHYTTDTVRNYVGTMYRFSGDPAVNKNPEEFIWFVPPAGYKAMFINYRLSNNRTVGESDKHEEPFFRRFNDGSGAAYCTFMGGDSRTVSVSNTGGTPGRRLLIVKDSFGNAMASNLFGSFEEVHIVDFRYFPHNLIDYIHKNNITDVCFVNCTSLAFAPNTASRLRIMAGNEKDIHSELRDDTFSHETEEDDDDEIDEEDS